MLDKLKQFFADLEERAKQDWKLIWNSSKGYIIAFGALIAVIKFREIIISLLVSGAKKIDENAKKQDAVLVAQENKANDEANALVKQAQEEPSKEKPVTDDWNKDAK